ncbi:hypothetical protein NDN08_003109 [Rhodosorus marinus]|uniref:Gfd2/YDR514C-like C-terminal domain-containing protein n=1 Tax=Rhodosorus marinus TaxID=101924 RepID=A0AAV8UYD7_9RHOD|nr:hypothetical protein NDN08_003109 [Rhodosorus marinus]
MSFSPSIVDSAIASRFYGLRQTVLAKFPFLRRMEEGHFPLPHVHRTWGRGQPKEKRESFDIALKEAVLRCCGAELFIGSRPEPVTLNGLVFKDLFVNSTAFASMKETAEAFAAGEVATIQSAAEEDWHELTRAEYEDVKDITQLLRDVSKHNKKVRDKLKSQERAEEATKRQTALMANLRSKLEGGSKLLSIDVEAWERDQSKMLEIGAVLFELKGDLAVPELNILSCKHFVVRENAFRRNGRYVPDRRDHFNFGMSEIAGQATIFSQLSDLVSRAGFVLGHNFKSDVDFLKNSGFTFDDLSKVLDTEGLSRQLLQMRESTSVENLLSAMDIEYNNLHNAGNDAFYTMKIFYHLLKEEDLQKYRSKLDHIRTKRIVRRAKHKLLVRAKALAAENSKLAKQR